MSEALENPSAIPCGASRYEEFGDNQAENRHLKLELLPPRQLPLGEEIPSHSHSR